VDRPLFGIVLVGAHLELSGRDPDHVWKRGFTRGLQCPGCSRVSCMHGHVKPQYTIIPGA
jgi:hypothetical protein